MYAATQPGVLALPIAAISLWAYDADGKTVTVSWTSNDWSLFW